MTISPLLSEQDAVSLHKHFVNVEIGQISQEIGQIEHELEEFEDNVLEDKTWPAGMPVLIKPPNRWQVPVWEYFTDLEIFKNEPNQNSRPLTGNDALDVREVIEVARRKVEVELEDGFAEVGTTFNPNKMEFVRLRSGYRVFNARRGMEYILDLEYRWITKEIQDLILKVNKYSKQNNN